MGVCVCDYWLYYFLLQFNPHSNLGTAIEELIEELIKNPPQFEPNIAMATQPWAFSNPSIGSV